jgi:hypothetical protein
MIAGCSGSAFQIDRANRAMQRDHRYVTADQRFIDGADNAEVWLIVWRHWTAPNCGSLEAVSHFEMKGSSPQITFCD